MTGDLSEVLISIWKAELLGANIKLPHHILNKMPKIKGRFFYWFSYSPQGVDLIRKAN